MKTIISLIAAFVLTTTTYAQVPENSQKSNEDLIGTELPAVVIKKVGEDFSMYLPETENTDSKINYIQNTFIAYDLGKDLEGYDDYLVTLKIKDAVLIATYNEKGKLINVVEKYKNVKLPKAVLDRIAKQYPDWTIKDDKYSYSQADGNITEKHYLVILKKDNKTKKVTFNSKGELVSR